MCTLRERQRAVFLAILLSEKSDSRLQAAARTRIQTYANVLPILHLADDLPDFLEPRAQHIACARL